MLWGRRESPQFVRPSPLSLSESNSEFDSKMGKERIELSTPTSSAYCSPTELLPHYRNI